MAQKQKDNSTFDLKRRLRLSVLRQIDKPVVMETHGGIGKLYASCYSSIQRGVVFERDPNKANFLARQRPSWAVYQCDVERALQAGVGAHLEVTFLDLDPYGSPWPAVSAFFSSGRPFASTMAIVVNDGLRQILRLNKGLKVGVLESVVGHYGNDAMYKRYKELCRELLADTIIQRGYRIKSWTAYYCGVGKGAGSVTHWAAILTRNRATSVAELPSSNQSDTLIEKGTI